VKRLLARSHSSVLGVVLVTLTLALTGSTAAGVAPSAGAAVAPAAVTTQAVRQLAPAATACPTRVSRPFHPIRIATPGKWSNVVWPNRVNGQPGMPPLTTTGKRKFAYDRFGIRVGMTFGHVLLNAHTWPDGSALGNRLLRTLKVGSRIIVVGKTRWMCFRVTERLSIPAGARYPRYYRTTGPHRLAIVVCSGRRLGPGRWTHRTIWFAAPSR
jgi:hypothetical protein